MRWSRATAEEAVRRSYVMKAAINGPTSGSFRDFVTDVEAGIVAALSKAADTAIANGCDDVAAKILALMVGEDGSENSGEGSKTT